MNKVELVKKLKAELVKNVEGWDDLSSKERKEELTKINSIGPNMTDVAQYCSDEGWDLDAFCSLVYEVVFGEKWDINLGWESW